MTAPDYNQLAADAGETADALLQRAFEYGQAFLEFHDKASMAEAILMIGHALLTQRDLHYEERRTSELATESEKAERHIQAAHDYDFLKALLLSARSNFSDEEYREAQKRIQRLAGL